MRESRELLHIALAASGTGTFRWNPSTGEFLAFDNELKRLIGLGPEEPVKALQDFVARIHPEDIPAFIPAIDRCRHGADFEMEFRITLPDGSIRWLYDRAMMEHDGNGKPTYLVGACMDITRRKQTENSLRRSDRLAATGELASTIAHEINNPMQALTNLLAILCYKTSLDKDSRALADLAQAEVKRMAHITRQMLAFHRNSLVPVPVRITEILEDSLELWAIKMKGKIRVERKYESTDHIQAFPGEMRQVFANLIGNAVEATTDDDEKIRLHVFASRDWRNPKRRGLRVVVADHGSGIKPEHRASIFEPFFTTKGERGTGLGLWVVKGIVERHGGSIRLRSSVRPGKSGTVFSIFFPVEDVSIPTPVQDVAAIA